MDAGHELTHARERLGLSVADIARRTKITEATILAIERNDTRAVPGIYLRGFLRAYAREVGCDPEQIVARSGARPGHQERECTETAGILTALLQARRESGGVHAADIDAMDRRSGRLQVMATVGMLCGGMLYLSFDRDIHDAPALSARRPVRPPYARLAAEPAAPVVVGTAGSSEAQTSIAEPSIGLRLGIQSHGPCWLSVTADGRRVVYRLLNAGERADIEAHQEVVLRIGDAASVALTINGMSAGRIGTAGQAVTMHLTPQNYQAFLGR